MKIKNVVLLVVSGALAVLLSGCGAKDCPVDIGDQIMAAIQGLGDEAKGGKSPEELKKMCFEKASEFKKYDGCKLPEKDKNGKVDLKDPTTGNKITNFSIKQFEDFCNR